MFTVWAKIRIDKQRCYHSIVSSLGYQSKIKSTCSRSLLVKRKTGSVVCSSVILALGKLSCYSGNSRTICTTGLAHYTCLQQIRGSVCLFTNVLFRPSCAIVRPIKKAACGQTTLIVPARAYHQFNATQQRNLSSEMASSKSTLKEAILLGVGNPLLDISVMTDLEFLEKYDLEADNAIIAEERHRGMVDDMTSHYHAEYLPGGATQNSIRISQWLLQQPRATTIIGAVGDDKYGDILREKAQAVGVNVVYEVVRAVKTGTCAAVITGEDRSLVTELGAANMLSSDFLTQPDVWKWIEKADYYYIGGFVLPVCPEGVKKIVEHAAANNKTVIMNLHATFLCEHFVNKDLNIFPYVDILFGNGPEARKFSELQNFGTSQVDEIALKACALPKVNKKRARNVVFTQGRKPIYFASAESTHVSEVPCVAVAHDQVCDTIGCGDAFVGGFLSQLVHGQPISECVRCGIYAAGVVIRQCGCTYPDKPDFK